MTRISTNMFHYHKEDGTFSQEASTLGHSFRLMFSRLFPDACDEGFELVSERTGKVVKMYFDHDEIDCVGDIMLWMFKPYRNDSFNSLIVFND